MIAMHKHTRIFAVSMLLIGFLFSNPVMGLCMPMLSDVITVSHSEMTAGCCASKNDITQQYHDAGLIADSHGCDCCGCGLQTDDTKLPSEQPAIAVMLSSVNESIASWKTASAQAVAELLPESAYWDDYASRHSIYPFASDTDSHSPPLFILNQSLLN